jgi:dTDP-glucose 4,6-dehydratase
MAGHSIQLGNLSPKRDLTYVADTVEGFICAAQCPEAQGKAINIGSGQEISIGDLARKIADLMGKELHIDCEDERKRPEQSEVERLCADNDLARDLLGWEPHHDLDHGLRLTIEWIGTHLEQYRPDIYAV